MGEYKVNVNGKEFNLETEELTYISVVLMAGFRPDDNVEIKWVNERVGHEGDLNPGGSIYLNTHESVNITVTKF